MAIEKATETKKTNKNGQRMADAWANVSIVDQVGVEHALGGIPMQDENRVTQALYAKSGVEIGETKEVEVTLKLRISRVDHNPQPLQL